MAKIRQSSSDLLVMGMTCASCAGRVNEPQGQCASGSWGCLGQPISAEQGSAGIGLLISLACWSSGQEWSEAGFSLRVRRSLNCGPEVPDLGASQAGSDGRHREQRPGA